MVQPDKRFSSALVVDDDERLTLNLAALLQRLGLARVETATSLAQAIERLDGGWDLVICDIRLGRDSGLEVIERAQAVSNPAVIAMSGAASREEVFQLADIGVAAYLEKPFTIDQLETSLSRASQASDLLARAARAQIGRFGAREAQQVVRETMFREALALTQGNRHAAARLLKVDRRLVQMMAQQLDAYDAAQSESTGPAYAEAKDRRDGDEEL